MEWTPPPGPAPFLLLLLLLLLLRYPVSHFVVIKLHISSNEYNECNNKWPDFVLCDGMGVSTSTCRPMSTIGREDNGQVQPFPSIVNQHSFIPNNRLNHFNAIGRRPPSSSSSSSSFLLLPPPSTPPPPVKKGKMNQCDNAAT